MGFYSIYKIIKDMIRTLFGNKFLKLLIISIIVFSIFFIFGETGVFAVDISIGDNTYETSTYFDENISTKNYLIFYQSSTGKYLLVFGDTPLTADLVSGDTYNFHTSSPVYRVPGVWASTLQEIFNCSASDVYSNLNGFSRETSLSNIVYNNYDVKNSNGDIIIESSSYKNPSLGNSIENLQTLNFSNFIINANSYTDEIENNDGTLFMLFYNRSLSNPETTDGLYPIKEKGFTKGSIYTDVENSTSDNMVFSYPIFMSGVFFNIGSTYEIRFAKKVYNSEYQRMVYEYLGEPVQFTISSNVTQDYINQLNQQTATSTDSETTQDLQTSIDNQTQSINNINNSITDSNVDNSSIQLPTDNTLDPTQTGVDNIFQTIYHSFTSGTAQPIVFPIPYTNNSITLSPNYVYNMLNDNNANWLITIIQAFWWYIISRFIITDIMDKIRKIKEGNFENIENSNIKEDML